MHSFFVPVENMKRHFTGKRRGEGGWEVPPHSEGQVLLHDDPVQDIQEGPTRCPKGKHRFLQVLNLYVQYLPKKRHLYTNGRF